MKSALLVVSVFCALYVSAQSQQQHINDQVWKPSSPPLSIATPDGFMALNSKNVVRSPRDGKAVLNWDQYYKEQKQGDEHGKTTGTKRG